MWPVHGKPVDPSPYSPVQIVEVLAEYDGPKTFTFAAQDGQLHLAHCCGAEDGRERYLVTRLTDEKLSSLKANQVSVRRVIGRNCIVLEWADPENVEEAWKVSIDDLPAAAVPSDEVRLHPAVP
jgi:hypothetical protein